jgi:hypothetical protein
VNHADVKGHLADYLEGELSLDERALVDSHLDECHDCARDVDEMQNTIRLLRTLPEPVPPPMIAANVMRRIRTGETQPNFFERIGRTLGTVFESSFVLPASAIAVASLVVAVVQNPEFLSNLDVAGGNDASVVGRTDSAAALSMPFVGGAQSDRAPVNVAGAANAIQAPLRIQIGTFVTPDAQRRQVLPGLGRAPRLPDVWAANVPDRAGLAPGQGAGVFVSVDGLLSANGVTPPASQANGFFQNRSPAQIQNSGDGDPRDEWIAHALGNPIEFAHYIGSQNLAEQELWVSRLSDRAETRGLMDEIVRSLRESGDSTAAWVAEDFASQMASSREGSSNAD